MAESLEARNALRDMRDENGAMRPDFVAAIRQALAVEDAKAARALTRDLHEADLADLIEVLPSKDRVLLVRLLGCSFDVEALSELDETVRDDLMEMVPNDLIVAALRRLDGDDALYLIENLDEVDRVGILSKLPVADRATLSRALEYLRTPPAG